MLSNVQLPKLPTIEGTASMDREYRVAWTSTWSHPKPTASSAMYSLSEAKAHMKYVADSGDPHVENVRIQVREWKDLDEL